MKKVITILLITGFISCKKEIKETPVQKVNYVRIDTKMNDGGLVIGNQIVKVQSR